MKASFLLCIILFTALALRASLLAIGITIDDACTAAVVERQWSDFVQNIKVWEMSPPLYFALLKLFTDACGITTINMALPSLVYGVATVAAAWMLGKAAAHERGPRYVAAMTATLTALSPLAIIYSHEARTYALAGLLLTLLTAYSERLFKPAAKVDMVVVTVLAVLLVYTHYTAIFYLCLLTLTALSRQYFHKTRGSEPGGTRLSVATIVALLSLAPWLPVLFFHKNVGTPWADPTPLSDFAHVFAGNLAATMPLPVVISYILVWLAAAIALVFAVKNIKNLATTRVLQSLTQNHIVLAAILMLASSSSAFGYITPYMFGYVRYLSPLVPFTALLIALLMERLRPRVKTAATILLVVASLAGAIFEVYPMATTDRSGLRALARDIGRGDLPREKVLYITAPDFTGMIFDYYLRYEAGLRRLPLMQGFALPASAYRPIAHIEDVEVWRQEDLINRQMRAIKAADADQVILVLDDYRPESVKMPVRQGVENLVAAMDRTYKKLWTRNYPGKASSYTVVAYRK